MRIRLGETTSYNDMVYSPEKNGIYFVHTVGEVYGNYRAYEIVFYNISKNTYTTVYTSERGVEESYMDDNAIYFAKTDVSYTKNEKSGSYDYTCDLEITNYNFKTGAVNKQAFETLDIDAYWANLISTFGVDSYGRYYIATNEDKLYLFNSKGKLLSKTAGVTGIYEFAGFDKTNGNFITVERRIGDIGDMITAWQV